MIQRQWKSDKKTFRKRVRETVDKSLDEVFQNSIFVCYIIVYALHCENIEIFIEYAKRNKKDVTTFTTNECNLGERTSQ